MRLGAWPCVLQENSNSYDAYRSKEISERHRHRYEFNYDYKEQVEAKGMSVTGVSPDGKLVEIVEIKDHPWFVACQFHPEFKSTPLKAHPLFADFVKASKKNRG